MKKKPKTTSPGYESGGRRLMRKGKTPVLLGLEADEVKALDAARGDTPKTVWIRRVVRKALGLPPTA